MRPFAEGVARVVAVGVAAASTTGCLGTLDYLAREEALGAVSRVTPAGCDGPIASADAVEDDPTGDDRYGAVEVRISGLTAVGSRCSVSTHVAYVRRDGGAGPFTWVLELRKPVVVGTPAGPPPEGARGEPLAIGRPVRATIPPGGAALHALTLAAGDAVTLAASGEGAADVGVWLGGIALPWSRAPGLPTQELFVSPISATYEVRVRGNAGKAYVVFAVRGGSSGSTSDDAAAK